MTHAASHSHQNTQTGTSLVPQDPTGASALAPLCLIEAGRCFRLHEDLQDAEGRAKALSAVQSNAHILHTLDDPDYLISGTLVIWKKGGAFYVVPLGSPQP